MLLILKNFKEAKQADQLEGLDCEFCGVEKFDRSALGFGRSELANQHADSAGVDGRDFREIENDARVTGVQQVRKSFVGLIKRFAKAEAAAKFDNFNLRMGTNFNFQGMSLSFGLVDGAARVLAILQACLVNSALNLEEVERFCNSRKALRAGSRGIGHFPARKVRTAS